MSDLLKCLVGQIGSYQKTDPEKMNILKTVYGEIELKKFRQKNEFTDENVISVFKKFKAGVAENISILRESGREPTEIMLKEISIYDEWIPSNLSIEEVKNELEILILRHLDAKSDGQFIGAAMAYFRKNGIAVDGKEVSSIAKFIREKYSE